MQVTGQGQAVISKLNYTASHYAKPCCSLCPTVPNPASTGLTGMTDTLFKDPHANQLVNNGQSFDSLTPDSLSAGYTLGARKWNSRGEIAVNAAVGCSQVLGMSSKASGYREATGHFPGITRTLKRPERGRGCTISGSQLRRA